jgi:chemotaxis signal transduction protein
MSAMAANSFVLFPMGAKRFALPAACVAELARPDRLQAFPHTTPLLAGVLVRRGHIIPVCDIADVLVGPSSPPRKFFLIANRTFYGNGKTRAVEWTAIPVTGECELTNAPLVPPARRLPEYVTGLVRILDEIIEVLDLDKLILEGAGTAVLEVRA